MESSEVKVSNFDEGIRQFNVMLSNVIIIHFDKWNGEILETFVISVAKEIYPIIRGYEQYVPIARECYQNNCMYAKNVKNA